MDRINRIKTGGGGKIVAFEAKIYWSRFDYFPGHDGKREFARATVFYMDRYVDLFFFGRMARMLNKLGGAVEDVRWTVLGRLRTSELIDHDGNSRTTEDISVFRIDPVLTEETTDYEI